MTIRFKRIEEENDYAVFVNKYRNVIEGVTSDNANHYVYISDSWFRK